MFKIKNLLYVLLLSFILVLGACGSDDAAQDSEDNSTTVSADEAEEGTEEEEQETDEETDAAEEDEAEEDGATALYGTLTLDKTEGRIGDTVQLTAEDLLPEEDLTVVYVDMDGDFELGEDNYSFMGPVYQEVEKEVGEGTADEDGNWSGEITIPEGFGDDHDIIIYQGDTRAAKANFFVETVFSISPESGPVGTEIEIIGEGLSWKMFGSTWHVNYDNAYMGLLTAISTDGTAKANIRAAGKEGLHTLTIESGASGAPYLSRGSSAINYISTQNFTFEITEGEPEDEMYYVEETPEAASGGIDLPELENQDGVEISLNKETGIVDEAVVLSGSGLPENAEVTFDWHTMRGNRVTAAGFGPHIIDLGSVTTDENGEFTFDFDVPDDLGGLEHLIDIKVDDEIYGQTYFRILPSIVSIEPAEGPPGTPFTITIKGSGWTEFDNALGVTYDNAYIGYVCAFESQGTLTIPLVASGDPGYHLVDIYPSIYQGQRELPDIYRKPQLTYQEDHPGTGVPAIRTFFKVTEE